MSNCSESSINLEDGEKVEIKFSDDKIVLERVNDFLVLKKGSPKLFLSLRDFLEKVPMDERGKNHE